MIEPVKVGLLYIEVFQPLGVLWIVNVEVVQFVVSF